MKRLIAITTLALALSIQPVRADPPAPTDPVSMQANKEFNAGVFNCFVYVAVTAGTLCGSFLNWLTS